MEQLLVQLMNTNGVAGLLVGACVLLTFRLLVELGKFFWSLKKEKDQLSEKTTKELILAVKQNTDEIKKLEDSMTGLKTAISEMPKFKLDLKRLFTATKIIAGDKWPEIRDEIMRDADL